MKIVVDGFGGDYAPGEIVKGCELALKAHEELEIIITGKEEEIKKSLSSACERLIIKNADEVISYDEPPTVAIKRPNTSLGLAYDILKTEEDVVALVSAGSTGAVLAGGFLKIGRIKGVSRPALAPLLPTKKGTNVLLIDCGANADCKPINLAHFALMGSVYFSNLFSVKAPKVGLLSNGTEEGKGNELTKESYELLKKLPINFVGNIEARDIVSGEVDVVVSDGFSGNIALKSIEGAASLVTRKLKEEIKSGFWSKVGALFMKRAFKNLKSSMDYTKYGGSPFIGCKKIIIKSHGDSKAETISRAIEQAMEVSSLGIMEKIEKELSEIKIEE